MKASCIWRSVINSLRIGLLGILLLLSGTAAAQSAFATVKDMAKLKQQAAQADLPVVLLFTAEDCLYCDAMREHYLIPMSHTPEYAEQALFRQLYIESFSFLRNEDGELVGGDQISLRYGVDITPTVLFINAQGEEVAERIIGLSGADYFQTTLQQHIQQASRNQPLK
jgi:thioredoxin-related protein